ncbi:MAG TPA: SDR family oxidoreductase [Thermoanaerobaculia bacterium]|nr:SDR family oxidoreductase [Thermoanaerobaculia bacterium]
MKTLLLTGGTGHLGRIVVDRLSSDYRCVLLGRNETPDVDRVYGIVQLAGAFAMGSNIELFNTMLDSNLLSAVRAIEPLRDKIEDGGRIVAISSIASRTAPAGLAAYAVAKAALNTYVEVLAKDLKSRRITVNALLPTTLGADGVPYERVAEMIAFLLSEPAASLTGQLIAMTL